MLKNATLKEKIALTHDVYEFVFESEEEFQFEAGQFITFRMTTEEGKPCLRAYSIASKPEDKSHIFTVCIKIVADGKGSKILNELKVGDVLPFIGPNGKFVFNEENNKNSIFIATGTGVAPFKSMIEDQLGNKENRKDFTLIFGVRHLRDIFYQEWLDEMQKEYENFNYYLTISQPESKEWDGHVGRVTTLIEDLQIDNEEDEIYICGLKNMINSVTEMLTKKGVPEEIINFEKYD